MINDDKKVGINVRYNTFTYLIHEGIRSTFKNKKSTSTSVVMMSIALLIFGFFFTITQNINSIMQQIERKQGMQVFLYDVSDEEIEAVGEYIGNIDGVNPPEFRTKEDALNQLKNQFKDNQDALSVYEENNIFPVSYVVTLQDLSQSAQIQQKILDYDKGKDETDKVIKKITVKDETSKKLISLANGIKTITWLIIIALIVFSIFMISNTIKLTVYARRKEISIMKYVGATNSFIRWPFVVEGILIGIFSGAISISILGLSYNTIAAKVSQAPVISNMNINLYTFSDMFTLIIIVYAVLGVGIGAIGSQISMRKYLNV